jgi:hypothetical protein
MDSWHATFLGLRHLPREVTAFEVEVFFQFSAEEARIIEERRRPELKLGLALQIGFLRMSGRLLHAVRMVPPLLWRHLGERFGVAAPDLASLRAMYRRAPTLIEHPGAAIEGVIRHEEIDITQLAVDTHGHTDFAMALAKLLGFDLCPR